LKRGTLDIVSFVYFYLSPILLKYINLRNLLKCERNFVD
jgi:hypothetical protein